MFLATTALSEFWDDREEILFLGSWCLRQDRRSLWGGLRYSLLPSPWNDRKRFYEAVEYLESCCERLLSHLTDRLNALHGIEAPPRYWRILIGPWLTHHLHALYDRYIHLRAAFDQEASLKTLCLAPDSFRVPQDGAEHIRWILDDPYNLQIYSGLLNQMGYCFPTRSDDTREDPEPAPAFPRQAAQWGWRRLQRMGLLPLKSRWEVALYETGLPRSMMWKMAWRTGFRAQPLGLEEHWQAASSKPLFDERRNSLSGLSTADEFERLFVRMLPENFPSRYLEGYAAAREQARRALPEKPPVILSGIGWHFHELFKWVAAEATLKKRRLVALQHGGGYGVYRAIAMEQHEKKISDSFLVWGWGSENGGQPRNVPAPQLSMLPRQSKRIPARSGNPILFVATTNPLYFYRFFSSPQADQLKDYFEWQFRFFRVLPSVLRDRFLFRPHSHSYPHGLKELFGQQFPDLRWDNGSTFHQSLGRSSLAVIDHLGTPLLETLAADWPTLLYWDPRQWEVRPEAQPFFDSLRRAGILWDSPETAATQLEKISDKPEEWWGQSMIRKARREFVDHYARSQGDWANVWQRVLADEVSLAGKR